MVNEHDEAEVRMMGSDQGFHNVSLWNEGTHFSDCLTNLSQQ
jgi:hypothetical protein